MRANEHENRETDPAGAQQKAPREKRGASGDAIESDVFPRSSVDDAQSDIVPA